MSTEIGDHMDEEEKEELRRRGYVIEGSEVSAPMTFMPAPTTVTPQTAVPTTPPPTAAPTETQTEPEPSAPPPSAPTGFPDGSLLDPFTRQFQAPDMGAAARAALGILPDVPQFQGPEVPSIDPFQVGDPYRSPTGEEITSDPSFRFRLDEGLQALQNAAAVKGLLRSGGTLKDFIRYGQGFASNEYQNIDTRNRATYGMNLANRRDAYAMNTANTFGTFDRRFDVAEAEFAPQMTGYQTQAQAAQRGAELSYDRAWKEYLTDWDMFEQNQQKVFDRLFAQQELGVRAAGA